LYPGRISRPNPQTARELCVDACGAAREITWFREELDARGIEPYIPSSRSPKVPYADETTLYRQHQKVEICSPGSRTGGASPPVTTDAHAPFFTICIAAACTIWL